MPCVKSGARAGSLYRNLVAHALTLGASGDRAPVRQQPWVYLKFPTIIPFSGCPYVTNSMSPAMGNNFLSNKNSK